MPAVLNHRPACGQKGTGVFSRLLNAACEGLTGYVDGRTVNRRPTFSPNSSQRSCRAAAVRPWLHV
jgi:hypothetical protein